MNSPVRRWAVVAMLLAIAVGCSSTPDVSTTEPTNLGAVSPNPVISAPAETSEESPIATTDVADDKSVEDDSGAADEQVAETDSGSETPPEQDLVTDGPVFLEGIDLPTIGVTSPLVGGELRPLLAWSPVDNAVTYEVSLYAESGEIYWAWSGETPSIPVGGEPRLGPNSAGPVASPGMYWFVLAIDENGVIIGQSPIMTILV